MKYCVLVSFHFCKFIDNYRCTLCCHIVCAQEISTNDNIYRLPFLFVYIFSSWCIVRNIRHTQKKKNRMISKYKIVVVCIYFSYDMRNAVAAKSN